MVYGENVRNKSPLPLCLSRQITAGEKMRNGISITNTETQATSFENAK
jgi:hypothetical protein